MHGIEVVAFVSSVGKINLPSYNQRPLGDDDENDDDKSEILSPEFIKLLKTVTREEVDKYTTRCPHSETSDKMTKVRKLAVSISSMLNFVCSVSFAQKKPKILSAER